MQLLFLLNILMLLSLYSMQEYQLYYDIFFGGYIKFDLYLFNNKVDNNFFYSGFIENIEDAISKDKSQLKNGNHPLVYILNRNYIQYINLFSKNTIFITLQQYIEYIKNYSKDFTIFILRKEEDYEFIAYSGFYKEENLYYVKIGKQLDGYMEKNLYLIIFLNTFIPLSISFIIRKAIKKVDEEFLLSVHPLIITISDILIITNFCNDISFLIFRNLGFNFIADYMTLFLYTFYKSIFYTTILVVLLGWTILSFFGWENTYKSLNKKILLYDVIFSIIIILSLYFVYVTNQLNLFYIKNTSEYLFLLCFNIYCVIKKIIPLFNQLNFEQSIRSNRVRCLKFKLRKLFLVSLVLFAYAIIFLNSPIIDKKYIYGYIDNFSIYLIFQLFYENVFLIFFVIIFYPKTLPMYYFDDVVFNYRAKVFLFANISEEKDGIQKLNISNLTADKLKKFSKKEDYPIVFINPFTSTKNSSLFNEIHIGITQLAEKDL